MNNKPVFVTRPSLPPLEEYTDLLQQVWETGILTHNGPLVQRFEGEFSRLLGIDDFVTTTNGTVALQMAIKALELEGEIITTPFSWIATISAIKWERCVPVFCDIDPGTLNIDVNKIESLINERTVAIMPVHTFGTACDVNAIAALAKKHNLKVIYDAAHAVGTQVEGKSVFEYGDISATSLHSTKLINTAEGGGCVTQNAQLLEKLKRIRFFGHDDNKIIVEDGFNGKMTEVHAALGLANLRYYNDILSDRKDKYQKYKAGLQGNSSITFQDTANGQTNYSYFPVIFETEDILHRVVKLLADQEIYPRRYFYPSLNLHEQVMKSVPMPVSEDISKKILCLPLFWKLNNEVIDIVVDCIQKIR